MLCQVALGLRRSEACGLDWSDFDWRRGWVHVQRGAHWVGGEVVECATKTKLSDRWLRVPRWALARLRQLRGRLRSGRLRGGLAPHQIAGRFKRLCGRLGLPWVPIYDNLPDAWTHGPVFALRLVHWLSDDHCAVWLLESYPQHRIWANFYNIGAWSGWEQV